MKVRALAMRLERYERAWNQRQGLYYWFAKCLIDDGLVCGDDRDALLARVHAIDVERGYRAPFDTDHVHVVERDAPPVSS